MEAENSVHTPTPLQLHVIPTDWSKASYYRFTIHVCCICNNPQCQYAAKSDSFLVQPNINKPADTSSSALDRSLQILPGNVTLCCGRCQALVPVVLRSSCASTDPEGSRLFIFNLMNVNECNFFSVLPDNSHLSRSQEHYQTIAAHS